MTTSRTPEPVLRQQAERIVAGLRTVAAMTVPRMKRIFSFGIAMDDKIVTIEMPWETIDETSDAALVEYILGKMQGREPQ